MHPNYLPTGETCVYKSLAEIERFCRDDGWNEGLGLAINQTTITNAKGLLAANRDLSYDLEATDSGCIQIDFHVSHKHKLRVMVSEEKYLIGFYSGVISFEVEKKTREVWSVGKMIGGFISFYTVAFS